MIKIAIHSVPRSGSTWLGEVFNSSNKTKYCFQPLFSYRFKDYLSPQSTLTDVEEFFQQLALSTDDFILQASQRKNGTLPVFPFSDFSHVVYKEVRYHHILENLCNLRCNIKFVLLIRDPIEVMNSWINSPKEFHPSWNIDEELLMAPKKNRSRAEEFYGLQAWIDTTKLFEQLASTFPDDVILVQYSELKKNPVQTTKILFDFCHLPYENDTASFLRQSQTTFVGGTYSVFRGGRQSKLTLTTTHIQLIVDLVTQNGLEKYLPRNMSSSPNLSST